MSVHMTGTDTAKRASPFQRYYRLLFFAGLYALYLGVLFGMTAFSDAGHAGHDVARVIAPAFELGLALFLCAASVRVARWSGRGGWLLGAAVVAVAVAAVYLAQVYALYLSNNFISVLALQNGDSAAFVTSPRALAGCVLMLAWVALFLFGLLRSGYGRLPVSGVGVERWPRAWFALALVLLIAVNAWLPGLQNKNVRLEPGFRQVPVSNLLVNAYAARFDANGGDTRTPQAVMTAVRSGTCFSYPTQPGLAAYPFQKSRVYRHALPFPAMPRAPARPPNVIVIFTEGMSARMIDAYGGTHPGLTPNIDRLAVKSMRVVNYFNHTAATYRGLIGQLSSGYSFAGGSGKTGWETADNKAALKRIHRRTLPMILDERGYRTYFFSPHHEHGAFTLMLRSLGFDRVFTRESIGNDLLHGHFKDRSGTGALDDQSLFAGLTAFLRQRQRQRKAGTPPFFIGLYNIGTHAFIGVDSYDQSYGDGASKVLNRIHTYDAALGRFLTYFEHSPYARNTILIFTADHAEYPSAAYRAVAGKGLKPYFVDRIPLLVLDPFHALPKTHDAAGRDSLDLAPTVLQLLGVRKAQNSFLGHSLFEPRNFPLPITALGPGFFMTSPAGVFAGKNVPSEYRAMFDCEEGVVRRYYRMERSNHIFRPAKTDGAGAGTERAPAEAGLR